MSAMTIPNKLGLYKLDLVQSPCPVHPSKLIPHRSAMAYSSNLEASSMWLSLLQFNQTAFSLSILLVRDTDSTSTISIKHEAG